MRCGLMWQKGSLGGQSIDEARAVLAELRTSLMDAANARPFFKAAWGPIERAGG